LRILIVGGGKVAEEVLNLIDPRKHSVYLVEKDPERRQEILSKYDIVVIGKDATDASLYSSDVKMDQIDMVMALTNNDEVNLLVLAISKIYNVPHRLARITDRGIADLIRDLGLGVPFVEPSIIASTIYNHIHSTTSPIELNKINVNGATYGLYVVSLTETDKACGVKLRDLELPEDIKVIMVFDGHGFKAPNPDEELKPGYQLIVLSSVRDFERYFKG